MRFRHSERVATSPTLQLNTITVVVFDMVFQAFSIFETTITRLSWALMPPLLCLALSDRLAMLRGVVLPESLTTPKLLAACRALMDVP
ncbi:hypothetical protein DVR14_23965 (plasmid) [Natrinema thermotolerans]|nr:hypothetical protein DVR14_23965 [Natrinema thermotolerans]